MADDQIMRVVLAACLAPLVPVGLYYRMRSQTSREVLDRKQEGWFILLTLRPAGLATIAALVAFVVRPQLIAWSSIMLPLWSRLVGAGLMVFAGALLIWTFRSLGANLTDTVVTRKNHSLVTSGPYRFVRHPFYDAMALFISGASLMAASWFVLLMGSVALVLIVVRTRTEEAKLIERFGEEYGRYVARTGRFVPRF